MASPLTHPTAPNHSSIMFFTSESLYCLRCTSFGLRCSVDRLESSRPHTKSLCNHCAAAGLPVCFFSPAIREIHPIRNSRCLSCMNTGSRCKFTNPTNSHCIRCAKQHLDCVFTLSGKEYYLFMYITLISDVALNYHACSLYIIISSGHTHRY